MADSLLLRALKGKPKQITLSSKKLVMLPKLIGKIESVVQLHLQNNRLKTLPKEMENLDQLQVLNLGKNEFEDLPEVIRFLTSLERLHLFANRLTSLNPDVVASLYKLTVLNLNNNKLTSLPPEIYKMSNLRHLSVDNNQLKTLPVELCALSYLEELHLAGNELVSLPLEFGFLTRLVKLHVQKNKIRELPESLTKCYNLRYLDIAANELRIFPTEMDTLSLKEMYCEQNPLLEYKPVHSVQEEEVLSLKELCARYVLKEMKDRFSYLQHKIRHFPEIKEMLQQSSRCAVCGESFLNTWLECVRFLDSKKSLKVGNFLGTLPVRALLCSYTCFNAGGHDYYGVAFP
ncbi:leucine-rich repeat-containing protein 69-like [Gigantopelta aegis]|uniref:leucine-rich repeat-containing protein 69-like n=1 Tax=Gigantopelta aegis TaxID=1735272 RepID=UPI001B8873AD|nr:leucine-rich repeat-containing protein 69-like [Gigantopelta aegis]